VKKGVIIAIILMAALVLPTIGIVSAESTISNMAYPIQTTKTWDGKWTTATEWVDAMPSNFGSNAAFRQGYEFTMVGDAYQILEDIIIETWDNTNDAGDYYQIGVDTAFPSTDTTPKATQYMINVTGHGSSAVLTWFKGDGTNWVTTAAPTTFKWNETSATSPTTAAAHYALEFQFDKTTLTQPEIGLYIAYYDAHAGGYGLQAWPSATTKNAAAGWGDIPYDMNPIPEGFNVGILLALTSVAVIAGAVLIRKHNLPKLVAI
jgi:hypothetical protein